MNYLRIKWLVNSRSELLTLPLVALRADDHPLEPAQSRVLELEARIAEQAAFIRLLRRNGEVVTAGVGQDVLKDLRRSLQAARKEMTDQAAAKEMPPGDELRG